MQAVEIVAQKYQVLGRNLWTVAGPLLVKLWASAYLLFR